MVEYANLRESNESSEISNELRSQEKLNVKELNEGIKTQRGDQVVTLAISRKLRGEKFRTREREREKLTTQI